MRSNRTVVDFFFSRCFRSSVTDTVEMTMKVDMGYEVDGILLGDRMAQLRPTLASR